jgi:ssDNA-binding Zn-finger/Zn-ribbon topoisomerase 1
MAAQLDRRLSGIGIAGWLAGMGLLGAAAWTALLAAEAGKSDEDAIDRLGANVACYVCHQTFISEEMSKVHLAAKTPCTKCHGLSAGHANDENIGATKPDVVYKRDQVDEMCAKCHETHDAPARKVIGRFIERKLPGGRAAVCTECHGAHRIDKAKATSGGT